MTFPADFLRCANSLQEVLSEFNNALTQIPNFLDLPAKNEYIATKFDLKQRNETR